MAQGGIKCFVGWHDLKIANTEETVRECTRCKHYQVLRVYHTFWKGTPYTKWEWVFTQ